jgi:hypothetical protein
LSYNKKELKNYLKDLLKGKSPLEAFSFEYQYGHTAFHPRLRIILSSDKIIHWKIPKGTQVDSKAESKAANKRELDFSTEKMSAFVEQLVKSKIWDLKNCSETALPDTPLLSFSIRNGDNLLFEQKVWENCRNDSAQTKELIKIIASLIPMDWPPP